MELTSELRNEVSAALEDEWHRARINVPIEGGNDSFEIRPCFAFTGAGDPFVAYGVFNKATGIREAETVQYSAAKQWVEALTRIAKGEEMPGLGRSVKTVAQSVGEQG